MKFDLDAVFVEDGCANSALATRVLRALPRNVPLTHVADAREAGAARARRARSDSAPASAARDRPRKLRS